jgi:hypothetical protein
MPTTYSTNLKIALPATGELAGTWGTLTNTNLGTLFEQAIVGAATIAMADANQTITITDGASSDGRAVYIKCTGALTAGRNLVVPTVNKNYIVENATTGGFDVTVKTTAGTGIAVKPSTKRAVYADATDVVEALSGFGALTVTSMAASGAVTAATVNGLTVTTSTGTVTISNAKTFSVSNTITLAGTDGVTTTLPPATGKIGWFVIGESDPSGASTVDFTSIPATINHLMAVYNFTVSSSSAVPCLRTYGADGVLDTGASDYYYNNFTINTLNGSSVTTATDSLLNLAATTVDSGTAGFGGDFTATNIQAATFTRFNYRNSYQSGASGYSAMGYGVRSEADRITGVRFLTTVGTMTGKITLMGSY